MKTISTILGLLLSFFILHQTANAQSSIEGKIFDANGPLPFANVLLLQPADSSLVRGSIANEDGTFLIEKVPASRYLLSVQMVGYQSNYQFVELTDNQRISAGDIEMSENVADLNTVTITAKKPLYEQKIDRLTVNVANSITSAGATVLDILERSPGVVVNRAQNALSLAGKDGVIFMINGKINRMPVEAVVQMLEGMPSSNIEKIELITTPPANFDAEGNAGFINIVLKETSDRGLNGSYTFSGGYGRGEVVSSGVNFNYRKGGINLYGDYSFSREAQDQLFSLNRTVLLDEVSLVTNTRSERDPVQRNHNARLGADFDLGKKTVLGLLVSGYDNRWSMDAINFNTLTADGALQERVEITNDEINHWKHIGSNLNLQHTFDKDHILTFDADYLRYSNENPTNYLNEFYDANDNLTFSENTFSGKETPIRVAVAKLDYSKRFSEKLKMEAGVKGTLSRFDNDVRVSRFKNGTEIPDPSLTNDFHLEESIGAAYTSFDVQLDEKTGIKLGLRYEYTNSQLDTLVKGDVVDRQFGRFFPSFFVSRNINDNNSVNFAYSRRITRPTFNEMAPFVIFFDPNTFIAGNAALQPSISDNLKLDYRHKTILFSLQYSHEDSAIVRFQRRIIPGTNQERMVSENMKNRKTASFTVSFPVKIADWWRVQNNLIGNWFEVNSYFEDGTPVRLRTQNFRATVINMFTLPKDFSAELIGFYQSKGLFGITTFLPFRGINLGIQKKLPNDNGSLRFGIDDVFNSLYFRGQTNFPEQNLVSNNRFDFSQRTFKLSYSRNFGNKKLKDQRRRATGAEEERQRVN
ncbi:MAG: outer membrane beta-barrel protein [Bacteroidota bacterium]